MNGSVSRCTVLAEIIKGWYSRGEISGLRRAYVGLFPNVEILNVEGPGTCLTLSVVCSYF